MHKITIHSLLTKDKPIEIYANNVITLATAVFRVTYAAINTYRALGHVRAFEETEEDVIVQASKDGKVIDIMRIHTTEVPNAPKGALWT